MIYSAGLYPVGYYSARTVNNAVPPVTPYMPTPFNQTAFWQPMASGAWLKPPSKSYSQPFEQIAKTAASVIANFLKSVQTVQASAKDILQKNTSALQSREADSSDRSSIWGAAQSGATVKSYQVKVQSLARAQTNIGSDLDKEDLTSIQSGTNRFKLTIGGKSSTITSNISSTDTNEQALTKLRNAINDAKTGVTAVIVSDSNAGTRRLELRSDATGAGSRFEIADEVGDAAAKSGIVSATTTASDAEYSVNGGATQTSGSNMIELEKGKASATLLKPTTDAVEVRIRPDEGQVTKQIGKLVSDYNAMQERLSEAGGYLSPAVKRSFDHSIDSNSFEQIGIVGRNSDGSLRFDATKLSASLELNFERTSKALAGFNGLAQSLEKATARFNDIPASSLLNKQMRDMQQFASYQASMQQVLQIPAKGLLLNGII
ncbi:flagellin hook IN motif-containing protein [Cohnella lupini]|uniref:Flagellar capping protein FliD n=1 Tax=Cohnella lupini TaxID=1294267 RepID=A0A3D9I1J2_9BACL|nr:flagellin hook IN motif-containing protein [Cohnella lupini]RED55479.1 flagellar capping protein FliD [Cohnella lupini]